MRIPLRPMMHASAEAANDQMARQLLEEIITVLVREIIYISEPYGVLGPSASGPCATGKRMRPGTWRGNKWRLNKKPGEGPGLCKRIVLQTLPCTRPVIVDIIHPLFIKCYNHTTLIHGANGYVGAVGGADVVERFHCVFFDATKVQKIPDTTQVFFEIFLCNIFSEKRLHSGSAIKATGKALLGFWRTCSRRLDRVRCRPLHTKVLARA